MNLSSQKIILNSQQKQAIEHGQGPLLIIAGAGTGKTTVITERIKWLIVKKSAKPAEILALTFTEKAAREMEERVDIAMPYGYTQMWISTFHAFCDRILRDEAVHIGLDPTYKLMTEAETVMFLRKHLFDLDLNYFRPAGNPTKFLEGLIQHFNRLQDEDVSPGEYCKYANKQMSPINKSISNKQISNEELKKTKELASAYQKYEELKIKENVMDFGDLISNGLKLFRQRPNILLQYQKQFKYILVDEFQDTNIAQNELVILLAGKIANLTVVADDDQSVYKWRGAAVSNVLQFKKTYSQAKIVTLIKNYRSTQEILDRAYDLIIHNNPDRLEVKEGINKKLISVRRKQGGKIEFIHKDRVENEADAVVKKIEQFLIAGQESPGCAYSHFAILVRANNHAEPFIRGLARAGIPYQFLGPGQLFRQPEVKDLIAYLKVLYNFADNVAMYKLLTMDIWKINPRDLASVINFSRRNNLSIFEACEKICANPHNNPRLCASIIHKETAPKISKVINIIKKHLGLISKETAGQILYFFLEESGLLKKMMDGKTLPQERRAQNISKFFDKLKTYEAENEDAGVFAVVDWLEMKMSLGESPLATDIDWLDNNAVNILTVHSAKGLEFPIVFLVNLVAQRFPTRERREQIPIPEELIKELLPQGDAHLQEERRLFYVGMTRAKDRLFLSGADYYAEGKREKKISPFVFEALGKLPIADKQQTVVGKQLSILDWQKPPATSHQLPATSYQLPVTYLSYSQIDTFKRCPLQYKYKSILRIPAAKHHAASFGTSIHQALRDFYYKWRQGIKQTEKDLIKLLELYWQPEGYHNKKHEQSYQKKGEKNLREFYQKSFSPQKIPLALEHNFKLPLPGFIFGGKIDRIDDLGNGCLEIIDYKTSEKIPLQKEVDRDLQLSAYSLAVCDKGLYNKKPEQVVLSLYFLETQEKISTKRTAEDLEKIKKEILDTAEKIRTSDFSARPSQMCQFCEYKMLCEAYT